MTSNLLIGFILVCISPVRKPQSMRSRQVNAPREGPVNVLPAQLKTLKRGSLFQRLLGQKNDVIDPQRVERPRSMGGKYGNLPVPNVGRHHRCYVVVPVAVDGSTQVGRWSDQVAERIEPKRLDRGSVHGPDRRPRRFSYPTAMTQMGHEDQSPPPSPNVGCWFGQGTLAGATCNGQDAPKAVATPLQSVDEAAS